MHVFQLWIISGPAFLVMLTVTFGVCSSVPPTPPTASAAEESEPFFRGLKQVKCFSPYVDYQSTVAAAFEHFKPSFDKVYRHLSSFLAFSYFKRRKLL